MEEVKRLLNLLYGTFFFSFLLMCVTSTGSVQGTLTQQQLQSLFNASAVAMATKDCPAGSKWDHLLVVCVKDETGQKPERHTEQPVIIVDQLRASVASVSTPSALMVGPALWSCVALVTLGSILALAVWFFIYRRQRRPSSSSEASVSGRELLQKTEAPAKQPLAETNRHTETFPGAAEVPSPCHHLHPGAQQGVRWGDGFTACRGPAMPSGSDGGAGLTVCISEHRIPLPATELGGTVLVTTKTM